MQEELSGFRLSPQQGRLLSLGLDGASNRARCAILLEGEADEAALREALSVVVGRHEILRTEFRQVPGIKLPLQFVGESAAVAWHDLELAGADPREEEAEVERVFRLVGERQHEGEGEVSATLLKLSGARRVLYVSASPLCADAATLLNLAVEIGRAYEAAVAGEEPEGEPIQYLVFSEWQNNLLEKEESEEGLAYWRGLGRADAPPLALPGESKSPREVAFRPSSHSFALDAETVARVDSAAAGHGATPEAFLLACWQALLWRLTSQAEFVVAATLDGRKFEALENVHGPFAKALPVASALDGRTRFGEAIARADEALAEASDWQEYFAWGREAEAYADEGRAAFLPVEFESVNCPAPFDAAGVRFSVQRHFACADRFKLKLLCVRAEGALRVELQYDPASYDGEAVARLAGQFRTLLEGAARDTQTPVGMLPLLTEEERQSLLHDWNATRAAFPSHLCLHELFTAQAALTPDAVAVTAGPRSLTYSELDRLSGRLARLLGSRGVGPDSVVGVLMRRSPEMLASLLGVMKAGGAYLPLDASLPARRLSFMLEDAGSRLLLTEPGLREASGGIETSRAFESIELDSAWGALSGYEGGEAPAAEVMPDAASPEHLAYVIYTSGSTGRPKGVMVTHRSLVNYLTWATGAYKAGGASSPSPVHSPLSFDLTVTSLWPPLLSGGRVELLDEGAGVEGLADALRGGQAFGLVKLTPAHMEVLRGVLPEGASPSASVMVIGGEALSGETVRFWRERAPGVRLINEYGPTEATVGCCVYEVGAEEEVTGGVPIGRPIANTRLYVLDAGMGAVPAGVGGELYIGGECLARGYLNRPALTAERFVPDAFSGEVGARLYRTGDVVRHGAGGGLEYVGRTDEQVKVRGFRVELGEVGAVLAAHESVREAVAVAREGGAGGKRVVAYVVAEGGTEPTASVLREYMRERVPEYMVPSAFVALERLPLTPNGKVDRRALPEPCAEEAEAADAPRTPVEEVVAGLWVELLGCRRAGAQDNFFSLGGHSLLATQMLLRVRKIFKVDVALRELFESPTVAGLAKNIELALGGKSEAALAPITPAKRDGALPLSFAQQRLWFLDQLKPGSAFYNVPVAVLLTGRLDVEALESTLTEVVRRHEVLRTHFSVAAGGEPAQVVSPPQRVELPPVDLSGWDEGERMAEAQRLAKEEAERAFNLSTGPLLRAGLIRLGEEEHVMLLTMHHIVSDGWSSGILIREVAALYEAYTEGRESPLEDLAVQYADFAVWQREHLKGEALERQLAYWKGQLEGAPTVLELPADRSRPAVQSYRGAVCSTALDEQLSEGLRELARRQGATLYMVLLAAFQTLLSRYTGQTDVVVGTPIANRNRAETEGLIGFFVNTQVMRASVEGREPFRELVGRVREVCLGAYAHQDVPFEMLVEELQPERSLSYSPLFQVMFVLQNYPLENLELPGLRLDSLSSGFETTKFDLTLFAVDEGGGRLRLAVEYSTALFDRERIERMLGHMETLLSGVVADPLRPVAALPLLAAAERRQLLEEWGAAGGEHDPRRCVHELFEAQAEQTPDAVALVFEDEELTYAELNSRANRLAHHLLAHGVGPDAAVGIMLERGAEMVVSLLAVLKAGGAYVPLDPAYPRERLAFMLEDACARVLLTDGPLGDGPPASDACRVLVLGDEREAVALRSDSNPPARASHDNLAYVIYTSGSTGRPKGIGLPHAALTNLIEWHFTAMSRRARVLQFASLSFDASFHEIFAAVCSGGTVYLVSEETRVDTAALARFISSASIEKAMLPVVVLQQLAETFSAQAQLFGSLREVVTTGEQMHITRAVTDLFKQLENCTLHNHYGPSESHVVTAYTLSDSPDEWVTHPPIGRPVSHTQIYVTDRDMNPAPVGVAGELLIGGVSLARGYVGRPGATAEKFIPDPFSGEPGARLYKTGDLACFTPGGDIKYLGRIDHQLKIRGFRVEPEEIESALGQHADVRETAVLAREFGPGDRRLVAYVVPEREREGLVAELRAHLRARLPEYMVPSFFVTLDAMPLTPNGKIDRRALPAPDGARADLRVYVAPRTAAEEVVADIWKSLLGPAQVGVEDNFFDLGGHSLLATQIISRVRETFQLEELPLQSLFESPTVAGLVEVLASLWGGREVVEEIAATVKELGRMLPGEIELMLSEHDADGQARESQPA